MASYDNATLNLIASFGAWTRSCLVPRYRSVVWTNFALFYLEPAYFAGFGSVREVIFGLVSEAVGRGLFSTGLVTVSAHAMHTGTPLKYISVSVLQRTH